MFNCRLSGVRHIIENSFGILAARYVYTNCVLSCNKEVVLWLVKMEAFPEAYYCAHLIR